MKNRTKLFLWKHNASTEYGIRNTECGIYCPHRVIRHHRRLTVHSAFRIPYSAFFVTVLLVLVFGQAVVAQDPPTPPPFDPAAVPTPEQPPSAALGASIYLSEQGCAACHGAQGDSDGPTSASLPVQPPLFSDPATVWARSPAEYFHITKFGNIQNLMPPWGNQLSDEQIWQAVYYAWSLHTDQATVQQGADRYAQSCAGCHGPTGAGDGPDASGEPPRFDDPGAMALRTQAELDEGWRLAHAEIGQEWDESERRAVLDSIRTFSYTPPWVSAYRPGEGEARGEVVQGTAGGAEVGSLPITLTAYVNFTPVETFTVTAAAGGAFQFDNLATDAGVAYVASTEYAGVRYNSTVYQFDPLTPTVEITLPVYETTDDGRAIHISRANWLVDSEAGALRIGLILAFSNQSDRTYIGQPVDGVEGTATLTLAVPPGATAVEFDDGVLGGRYQQVGDLIYDVVPIPPGDTARQLIYSYLFPFEGDSAELEQRILYPVGNLNLLITDLPGLEATAPDLTFVGEETVQGINFRRWVGEGLREPALRLQLRGLFPAGAGGVTELAGAAPGLTPATPPIEPVVALALGGLLLLVLAGAVYLPLRHQGGFDRAAALEQERDALIDEIAALDDQHAAGELDATAWSQERARLKSALLAVTQELAG
jgi:mono/diheme cytochrome c family protein